MSFDPTWGLHGNMTPAMEMTFDAIRDSLVYRGKRYIPLPRSSESMTTGDLLFYLTPNQSATIEEIQSEYVRWYQSSFRLYTTDTIFREKVGRKILNKNQTIATKKMWDGLTFPHPLRFVPQKMRPQYTAKQRKMMVDLGNWIEIYNQYSYRVATPLLVKRFMDFLVKRINDPIYHSYNRKIVYFPINQWFKNGEMLGFTRQHLTNPLAIILFAAYRYPELLEPLNDVIFILGDPRFDQFIVYRGDQFNKGNFIKVKQKLLMMKQSFKYDEGSEQELEADFAVSTDEEGNVIEEEEEIVPDKYADPKGIVPVVTEDSTPEEITRAKKIQNVRTQLINDAKKSALGTQYSSPKPKNSPPRTQQSPASKEDEDEEFDFGDDSPSDDTDLTENHDIYDDSELAAMSGEPKKPIFIDDEGDMDDEIMEAVDEELEDIIDEDPEILEDEEAASSPEMKSRIDNAVSFKIRQQFVPDRTAAQNKRIDELTAKQAEVLAAAKTSTLSDAQSKVIPKKSLDGVVKTGNEALKTATFANFDKAYNSQKLEDDIDAAIAILSTATVKVFVTEKIVEDSSDQLNLRKTLIYHLQDEYGGKHTLKFDIPVIIEDNFVYINGSKILLGHQMMMMPIVKTGPADVQIVSWYKKMTIRRFGSRDTRSDAIKAYMETHNQDFQISPGNAMIKNAAVHAPTNLDIDLYASHFVSFNINGYVFILDRQQLDAKLKQFTPNYVAETGYDKIPVGFIRKGAKVDVVYVTPDVNLSDIILSLLDDTAKTEIIKKTKNSARRLLVTKVKVMDKFIPVVMLACFFEGFTEVMRKAKVEYRIVRDANELVDYDKSKYDVLVLEDGWILWERNPLWNTMLMNGFASADMSIFTIADLDDKETYANILSNDFGNKNITVPLMQFYDFMIDPVTREILEDFNKPTDLVSLLLLANMMLIENAYTSVNSAEAIRIRSNEIIAQMVYLEVTSAYKAFRSTEYKASIGKKPDRIAVKKLGVTKGLVVNSSLSNEASEMNPLLSMENLHSASPKGPSGINKSRAMTLAKRQYDKSMLGIAGITTPNDANVGIVRQLTLEPNIVSVRGYVKPASDDEIEEMTNINLLTPAELLSPPGALHDDGPRTAMGGKQSKYMVPISGSAPVYFGNRVESVIPYHLDKTFVIVAKDDGEVVAIDNGIVIVRYKDGTYDSIDTNPQMKKNGSGFYIKTVMTSHLTEVGQKFKKDEVIATDERAFTKNDHDLSASMNIGVPIKIAVAPNYDIYEDACPITKAFSEKFSTYMSMRKDVGIPAHSYVEYMVNIGDEVQVDEPLIIFDPAHDDADTDAFLNELRKKLGENLADIVDIGSMPQVRAKYAGKIVKIDVYTSVPPEELSDSLREIFEKYTAHTNAVNAMLDNHKNPNDMNFYKCGKLITNSNDVVETSYDGRVKGVKIGEDGKGLAIIFYIEFKDRAKAGDKGTAFTALKFTTSHVIAEGYEPYSEYRPDEEISAFISPISIIARKTPSILETMFINKLMVEMSRHACEIFFDDIDPRDRWINRK